MVLFNPFNKVGAIGYLPTMLRPLLPYRCFEHEVFLETDLLFRIVKFDIDKEEPVLVNGRCVECGPGEVSRKVHNGIDIWPGWRVHWLD